MQKKNLIPLLYYTENKIIVPVVEYHGEGTDNGAAEHDEHGANTEPGEGQAGPGVGKPVVRSHKHGVFHEHNHVETQHSVPEIPLL